VAIAEEGGKSFDPETMKMVVGGDSKITVRKCGENGCTMAPTCTCMFMANSLPKFSSIPDEATIQRMCIITLTHRYSKSGVFKFCSENYYDAFFQIIMNIKPLDIHAHYPRIVLENREIYSRTNNADLAVLWDRIEKCPGKFLKLTELPESTVNAQYLKASIAGHFGQTFDNQRNGWPNLHLVDKTYVKSSEWRVPNLIFPRPPPTEEERLQYADEKLLQDRLEAEAYEAMLKKLPKIAETKRPERSPVRPAIYPDDPETEPDWVYDSRI
jgi:hypothetical protein